MGCPLRFWIEAGILRHLEMPLVNTLMGIKSLFKPLILDFSG
jgi:hypothetical protein